MIKRFVTAISFAMSEQETVRLLESGDITIVEAAQRTATSYEMLSQTSPKSAASGANAFLSKFPEIRPLLPGVAANPANAKLVNLSGMALDESVPFVLALARLWRVANPE